MYGRKQIDGYWHDAEPVGEELVPVVVARFRDDCPAPLMNAALALSPAAACLKHLTHLTLHKRIGSEDGDRAILLKDYVSALSGFPEFVLACACRCFWENDPREERHRPFMPRIDEIASVCREFCAAIEKNRTGGVALPQKPQTASLPRKRDRHDLPREKWTPHDWDAHIVDAENMLNLARQNPTVFKVEDWHEEVSRRMGQKAAAMQAKND